MATGIVFFYGNFIHPEKEVYPEDVRLRPVTDERGMRWATEVQMTIKGDMLNANGTPMTPALITSRINQMANAYNQDYRDCGFLMNGTLTPHRMNNSDPYNLSGNQVIHRSWDNVSPLEYQNIRSFTIVIRALYLHATSHVLQFSESVQKTGPGGPAWRMYETVGGAQRVDISDLSVVRHVQRGTVVGALYHLSAPPPLWPDDEHEDQRIIVQSSPKFYGNPRYRPGTQFRTDYVYFFERFGPSSTIPTAWPS